MWQQWGEKAGATPGRFPVTGTSPAMGSNQWWVCKPRALLGVLSPGGDISAGWSLGELSLRSSARVSPWGRAATSTRALPKVFVQPALLQPALSQPPLPPSRFALGLSHGLQPWRAQLRARAPCRLEARLLSAL